MVSSPTLDVMPCTDDSLVASQDLYSIILRVVLGVQYYANFSAENLISSLGGTLKRTEVRTLVRAVQKDINKQPKMRVITRHEDCEILTEVEAEMFKY